MKNTLASFFSGIALKRLSEVEVKPAKSNQHEFNGAKAIRDILGSEKAHFKGRFIYVSDNQQEFIGDTGDLTWYDARENNPLRAAEFRLYYSSNDVINSALPGDLVIITKTVENELNVIIADQDSTAEKQLLWLFGFKEIANKFEGRDLSQEKHVLGFAAKYIIESLGFEIEDELPDYLEIMLEKYGGKFPSTYIFSEFARATLKYPSPIESPDEVLLSLLEREEMLFKTLEKKIVQDKLKQGFGDDGMDVEMFIKFSLSVQNTRKSRAGLAFENQLAYVFDGHKVIYSKKAKTERNNTPDFLFPGIKEYKDPEFDTTLLTMLGLKTTAKERWTQILSEADRIERKHFITLEPSISKNQTDEMIARKIQLVLPNSIRNTYTEDQKQNIISLSDFIAYTLDKQKKVRNLH